jgi:hypothetical protein
MFPLITSDRLWTYGDGNGVENNITSATYPIRFNELFPALRLRAVLNMIETQFGINFDGTATDPSTFLNTDARFTNAYLYMKNAEIFKAENQLTKIDYTSKSSPNETGLDMDLTNDKLLITAIPSFVMGGLAVYDFQYRQFSYSVTTSTVGVPFTLSVYKNGNLIRQDEYTSTSGGVYIIAIPTIYSFEASTDYYECFVGCSQQLSFTRGFNGLARYQYVTTGATIIKNCSGSGGGTTQTTPTYYLPIKSCFPEIKIEDFFSGLLKMFNLTCYSSDGINYTVEQLESYYGAGSDVDITKYVIQDKKGLNRVKTYKKINFDYEKSDSFINVAFNSNAGIEYGSLRYVNNPPSDGEEYSIKLPFEDLNFSNLEDVLQVGYCLKTDYQKYIPKPIILYDYNSADTTDLLTASFYFSQNLTGTGTEYTTYKAFGQETLISSVTYGLNFPTQQSTLTNEIVTKGLYDQYYSAYFANIFNYKARLIKVSAILPTSILTSLKLNDNVLIRDTKYLINTFTTDLTTGEVQFELLTDQRI